MGDHQADAARAARHERGLAADVEQIAHRSAVYRAARANGSFIEAEWTRALLMPAHPMRMACVRLTPVGAAGTKVGVVGHVEWVQFARVEHVPRAGEVVHASEPFDEPAGGGAVAAVQLAR